MDKTRKRKRNNNSNNNNNNSNNNSTSISNNNNSNNNSRKRGRMNNSQTLRRTSRVSQQVSKFKPFTKPQKKRPSLNRLVKKEQNLNEGEADEFGYLYIITPFTADKDGKILFKVVDI